MAAKTKWSANSQQHDKKPHDDWELENPRKEVSSLFKHSLLSQIGDSSAGLDQKGRDNRINTTENFDSQSELKTELGR